MPLLSPKPARPRLGAKIGALALALLAIPPAIQGADTITEDEDGFLQFVEDFEDEDQFDEPTSNIGWYVFQFEGSGNQIIKKDGSGNQYWASDPSSPSGFAYLTGTADACDGNGVTWKMRSTAPSGSGFRVGLKQTADSSAIGPHASFAFTPSGISAEARGTGPNIGSGPINGFSYNTWYTYTIKNIQCNGIVSAKFIIEELEFVITLQATLSGTTTFTNFGRLDYATSPPPHIDIDDVTFAGLQDATIPIGPPKATTTATGLVGFDVDRAGTNIITRTNGGATVEAFNAFSLHQVGSAQTPNCARFDGVAALSTHVVFVDCDAAGDADRLKLRSPTLGTPDVPEGCGEECPQDIEETSNINIPTELKQLAFLDLYFLQPEYFDSGTIAFSHSTFDGKVGTTAITYNNFGADHSQTRTVVYDSTTNPDVTAFCAWRASNGADLFGAVTPNGASAWYETRVDIQGTGSVDTRRPEVSIIGPILSNSGALGGAFGIDCAGNRAIVQNDAGVWVVSVGGEGVPTIQHGPIPVTAPKTRGVAISADANFIAWIDGPTIYVADAATGNVTGSATHPNPALHHDMALDSTAQNLWIADFDGITRSEVYHATTGRPTAGVATDQFGRPIDPNNPPGSQPPEDSVSVVDDWSPTLRFVVGLLIIAIPAGIAYRLAGPAPMVVGGAATLGMAAAVVLVSFPLWIPITIAAGGLGTWAAQMARRVGGVR